MTTFKIYDVINVEQVLSLRAPFNFRFSSRYESDQVQGPGIYVITFEEQPIYLGKFQPFHRNNILHDRWLRHMETMTMRGCRVGFGKNATLNKLKAYVHGDIYEYLADLSENELSKFLRDTGVCTSIRRCKFTAEKWNYLKESKPDNILNKYGFHFYKFKGIKNSEEAVFVSSSIERKLIKTYDFPINGHRGQQVLPKHAQVDLSLEKAIKELSPNIDVKLSFSLVA